MLFLDANALITIAIRLRSDYDVSRAPAFNSTQAKMNMSIFRRSRIVVTTLISSSIGEFIILLFKSRWTFCVTLQNVMRSSFCRL